MVPFFLIWDTSHITEDSLYKQLYIGLSGVQLSWTCSLKSIVGLYINKEYLSIWSKHLALYNKYFCTLINIYKFGLNTDAEPTQFLPNLCSLMEILFCSYTEFFNKHHIPPVNSVWLDTANFCSLTVKMVIFCIIKYLGDSVYLKIYSILTDTVLLHAKINIKSPWSLNCFWFLFYIIYCLKQGKWPIPDFLLQCIIWKKKNSVCENLIQQNNSKQWPWKLVSGQKLLKFI